MIFQALKHLMFTKTLKYYYLIFKGMKKSKTVTKIFALLGDFSILSECRNFIYESYCFKYF